MKKRGRKSGRNEEGKEKQKKRKQEEGERKGWNCRRGSFC
jgi:hypothetical protein